MDRYTVGLIVIFAFLLFGAFMSIASGMKIASSPCSELGDIELNRLPSRCLKELGR
jgi:hypothetical protein